MPSAAASIPRHAPSAALRMETSEDVGSGQADAATLRQAILDAVAGWDGVAVARQVDALSRLDGADTDPNARCGIANLRNANRLLRLVARIAETATTPDALSGPDCPEHGAACSGCGSCCAA